MKIHITLLFVFFFLSMTFAQDSTYMSGYLYRVNYLTGEETILEDAPWYQLKDGPYSDNLTYEEAVKLGDSLYIHKQYVKGAYSPGMTHELFNPKTRYTTSIGHTYVSDMVSSSFFLMPSWWLQIADGYGFLSGFYQELYVSPANLQEAEKPIFDYSDWDTNANIWSYIIGKMGDRYLIAHDNENSSEFEYFTASIDNQANVTIIDSLHHSFIHTQIPELFTPCIMKNITESVFLMSENTYDNYLGIVTEDSIKTTDIGPRSAAKIYNRHLYYIEDNKIVKQAVDTTNGTLSDKAYLNVNFTPSGMITSDFSNNILFWSFDTITVFSVPDETVLYHKYFPSDPDEFLTRLTSTWSRNVIFIDDNYFYLHKVNYTSDLENTNETATEFRLNQNYPNPFNPTTTIQFALPQKSVVKLAIYDAIGQLVKTVVSEELTAGHHQYQWNASNIASGLYFYRIEAGNFVETKKMILLK